MTVRTAAAPMAPATGLARELRPLLALAGPVVAGQLAQIGTVVVDNVVAGHLGARVLGSVAVGGSLYVLMLMFVVGTMTSLQPTVAALDGAGRRSEVSPYFTQAVLLGGSLGLLGAAALALSGPPLFRLVGIAPSLLPGATAFILAVAAGGPALGLFAAARGLSEGLSRTLPTLVLQVAGLLLLAPLCWSLMAGRLGAPPLGPLGSGLATAATSWAEALGYLLYLRVSPSYEGLDWSRASWRPQPRLLVPLLRVGLPSAVSSVTEAGMFSAAGLIVGGLGERAAAANQVALGLITVTFMVPLGLTVAVTVRVGRAVGRNDRLAVRRAAAAGLAVVVLTQFAAAILFLAVPRHLVALYMDDPATVGLAASLLGVGALFQLSDGVQVLANGALRGLRDTAVPMVITTISYWGVGVPVGAVLALALHQGPIGMWVGMLAGLTPAALLLGARFIRLTTPDRWSRRTAR